MSPQTTFEDGIVPIVVDMGTQTYRFGFGGDKAPKSRLPAALGVLAERSVDEEGDVTELSYIAGYNELVESDLPPTVDINPVMRRGQVDDWAAFETIMEYGVSSSMFHDEAGIEDIVEAVPFVFSDSVVARRSQRERVMSLLFDQWRCPGLSFCLSGVLSMYTTDSYSALAVESGEGFTAVYPVLEGCVPRDAIERVDVTGADITDRFVSHITSSAEPLYPEGTAVSQSIFRTRATAQRMKEAVSGTKATVESDIIPYRLPDGQTILVPPDLMVAGSEMLLNDSTGIPAAIRRLAENTTSTQKKLCSRLSCMGGNFLMPGLIAATTAAINDTETLEKLEVPVADSMGRPDDSAWMGGSMLANLVSIPGTPFDDLFLTRADYEESGADYWLDRKFT